MKLEKIKWNMAGFRELRTSPEVQAELGRRARNIQAAAGEGTRVTVKVGHGGRGRARATVVTDTPEARVAEARHRTLTRALDAGRG